MPVPRPPLRGELFEQAVSESVRFLQHHSDVMTGLVVGVEEVPPPQAPWATTQIPLAVAVEASAERPARVVMYRRPIEHRAASPRGVRILVHRTLVEQVAALTGRSVADLDPLGRYDEDE